MNSKREPEKILILRLSSIGDILLSTPLIRSLRRRFPHARIDFVVKSQFAELLCTNPHLNELYTLDTKKGRPALSELRQRLRAQKYDLIIDIHNNFRSGYLRRQKNARIVTVRKYKLQRFLLVKFGWNFYRHITPAHRRYLNTVTEYGIFDDGQGLEFFPDADVQKEIDVLLEQKGRQPGRLLVCLAPGASVETKRWPAERFAAVAKKLIHDLGAQILFLGDSRDAELTNAVNSKLDGAGIDLAGKLTLMQSACALNRADMALTNDSGLMHLATALGKPTTAVFGSTVRELGFFPVGPRTAVVENKELACRPCTHIGRRRCPKKHFRCMLDIPPKTVFDAATALLRQSLS